MHANARLTVRARRTLVERIQSGRPIAHVADEMGVSRQTAHKWWRRWQAHGDAGLRDRSSRPHASPARTPRRVERRVEQLRVVPRSSVRPGSAGSSSCLRRRCIRSCAATGLNRVAWMDRPTGRVIRRRIEHDRPGEQLQMDVKKLGRIPPGGGWRAHGRGNVVEHRATMVGYAYVHTAIDSHTRLAYSEVLPDEKADHRDRLRATRPRVVRGARHHRRGDPDRQRVVLQGPRVHRGDRRARRPPSPTPTPTTGHGTAKSNGSTAPSSRNGPTSASTDQKPPAPPRLTAGSTSTTITAPTPASAASHPSPASTTCPGSTPSG